MSTKLGDLRVDLKLGLKQLRTDVNKATREINRVGKSVKKQSKGFDNWRNSMVRNVRQLETLYVAYKSIGSVMEHVVNKGIELNKMYEDQSLGIAALTSAKLKMYDSSGKELTSYEQFLASQQMTSEVMEDIKKAALETPASFQQMVGFYQQAIGHAISENKTFGDSIKDVNSNVILFTQRMSALGSAAGMEMPKINEEIRSLMSGNASTDSLLAMMLFGSPKAANEAVRAAKTRTGGLSKLLLTALEPFKHVEGVMTYSKAMAQLNATFDDLRKGATTPLFEDIVDLSLELKGYLQEIGGELINDLINAYDIFKTDVSVTLDYLGVMGDVLGDTIDLIWDGETALSSWTIMLALIRTAVDKLAAAFVGINMIINQAMRGVAFLNKYSGASRYSQMTPQEKAREESLMNRRGTKAADIALEKHQDVMNKKYDTELIYKKAISEIDKKQLEFKAKFDKLISTSPVDYAKAIDTQRKSYGITREIIKTNSDNLKLVSKTTNEKEKQLALNKAYAALEKNISGVTNDKQLEKIGTKFKNEMVRIEAFWKAKQGLIKQTGVAADSKKTNSGAKKAAAAKNKAQRDHNKMVKAELELQLKMAELLKAQLDLEDAKLGRLITSRQENQRQIDLAKKKVDIDKKAFADAKKAAGNTQGGGDQALKARQKVIDAEIKLVKSQTDMWKKINKDILEVAASFKDAMGSLIDSLTNGDFAGGLTGMFDNIITELVKPLKDEMSTMFGELFSKDGPLSSLFGGGGVLGSWASGIIGIGLGLLKSMFGEDNFVYSNVGTDFHNNGSDVQGILEHMDWAMTRTMRYSSGMYENLKALVRASGQAARGLIASGYTFGEKAPITKTGFLGFSSRNSQTNEQGIRFGGVDAKGLQSMLVKMFESGQTTKTKWWGLSSKTSQWYKEWGAPSETKDAIIRAYESGIKAITEANSLLKLGTADDLIKGFFSQLHKIDFQGMSQSDISQAIANAIGSDLDNWVRSYAGWVDEFAKGSEDAMETFMRVAYEFEVVQQLFDDLGGGLTQFAELGVRVSQAFIEASGGVEAAISNVEGYIENFYTEEEKQQLRLEQIMRGAGIMPEDADAYRKKIEQLTVLAGGGNTNAAELLAEMLRQQQLYYDYYEKLTEDQKELESKREDALDIQAENMSKEMAWQNERLDFYKDIQNKIESAYTGTLSYLNMIEKADFMSRLAQQQFETGDTQGYFDSLGKQLEYEKKMALTKEQYALKFDAYISELQNAEPEKTTDDVVQSLEDILEQNRRLEDAIANSSYQRPL